MPKKLRKRLKRLAKLSTKLPLPGQSPMRLTSPTDVVAAFVEAWEDNDADAIADLFVEDADFVNVVGLWWTSKRSIRRAHESGFEKPFAATKLIVDKVSERRVSKDVAVVHARWLLTGQVDPSGHASGPRRGVLMAVLRKLDDGTWIGVSAQNTDIRPSADTYVAAGDEIKPASYIPVPNPEVFKAADRAAIADLGYDPAEIRD